MDQRVAFTLRRLGVAYALAWAATSMVAGPGSAALVRLTGDLSHAGLYIAITYMGAAGGAWLGGRAMDRYGRKPPLLAAFLTSAVGYATAGAGVALSRVSVFVLGVLLVAMSFGTVNLTRVAAAEMFVPSERGKGVSWIQLSAVFGAIAGPVLLVSSAPLSTLFGWDALKLVWFFAPPLLLIGGAVLTTAYEPRELAVTASHTGAASPGSATDTPADTLKGGVAAAASPATAALGLAGIAATVTLAASQGAMAAIMGVAGAAISHAGHGVGVLGGVMFMHFVGMFGFSRVVGSLADRHGRRTAMLSGVSLLVLGGSTVALTASPMGFSAGLFLVGVGWSFGFIGATVTITDVTDVSRRAGVLGRADLGAQFSSAVIAVAGGWWFARYGVSGLGIVAIAVALLPLLFLMRLREHTPGRFDR